jgi:hypothetical protein
MVDVKRLRELLAELAGAPATLDKNKRLAAENKRLRAACNAALPILRTDGADDALRAVKKVEAALAEGGEA